MGALEDIDPSPFGLNVHEAHDLFPLFGGIGIRWLRVDLDWDAVEPEAGRLDWAAFDRIVEAAGESGVSLLASVAYTPPWASAPARQAGLSPDEIRALPPADPDLFAGFVHALLERYRDALQAVSLWNEPDSEQFWMGRLDEHLALWGAGLEEVRRTSPAMVTGGPDFSTWRAEGPLDFLAARPERQWMARALDRAGCRSASPLIDVVTHHQYGAGDTPAGRVAAIEDLQRFLVSRCRAAPPLWVTETGFATDKVSREEQARGLRATFEAMAPHSAWWKKTFWYDSHGRQGTADWGLLGPRSAPDALRPRPAFRAYADVIRAAGGAPAVRRETALRRVDLAYRGILGRDPDPAGHAVHARVAQTRSTEVVCDALLASDEFRERARQVSLEDVSSQFLAVVRGRDASPEERLALLEALGRRQAAPLAARIIEEATPAA